jgi:hypothetical protein
MLDRNFQRRLTRSQSCLVNYALMAQVMNMDEPKNYAEASRKKEWNESMEQELNSSMRIDIWDLVSLPKVKDVIDTKWVYKSKYKSDGTIDKYKVRLVAKGYAQNKRIDDTETFLPMEKLDIIQMVLALVSQYKWTIFHMDVE